MFTATELRFIKENYPEKLSSLLENLGIEKTDWDDLKEIGGYEKLDEKIVHSLCKKMKSESIIDGYTTLMRLGNLPFDYSETYNGLLNTILDKQNEIKNCLEEKISESKKPIEIKTETEEFDYGKVEFQFSRANFDFSVPMKPGKKFILSDRSVLRVPANLESQIKNLICEHFRIKEKFNVVEAIEVSVKTKNDNPESYYGKKTSIQSEIKNNIEPPPFNQNELSEVLDSLKLVEELVKSI